MRGLLLLLALLFPTHAMPANRLADSASLYLRMHADNPVDWHPWGDEAFEKAKREGKPVFLSIGYSACYWCRVAEETLYRDPAIAARMNAGFVNVKVDREERPDIDRLYQAASRMLGAPGGWPNNLFLTPERKPFFAGSYFPPADDEFGRPGFPTVLARVGAAWASLRADLAAIGERVADAMRQASGPSAALDPARWRRRAVEALLAHEDTEYGGLKSGGGAKFPQAPEVSLLLGDAKGRAAARRALSAMAASALRDHLGGGFHRYTVDPRWTTPHFEKMLYDNAQLLRLYAMAGRKGVARETADFMLREMQDAAGGFYAAFDAVSAGREGAHYLWREEEVRAALGKDADAFLAAYRIAPVVGHPNDDAFDAARGTILLRDGVAAKRLAGLASARAALLRAREARPKPARDDKIILAWNGLAIEALAAAGERLAEPRYAEAARRAADRLWKNAWEPGRLRHALFEGRPQGEGFLEDYACFGLGLLALGDRSRAVELAEAMLARFSRADGGLADSVHGEELFAALPESGDGPYPSGASAAWRLLDRLGRGDARFRAAAARLLAALAPAVEAAPERWPALVAALTAAPRLAPAGSAGVVSVSSRWEGKRLIVALAIVPGWHVNANPASDPGLIPTRIEFEGAQPAAVRYPEPSRFRAAFAKSEIEVLEGVAVIETDFAGRRPAGARLIVQACNEATCLAPATVALPMP